MQFKPELIDDFKSLFEANKEKIRAQEGCSYLELWQDIYDPSIFMTYSHWDSHEFLDQYRNSEVFNFIWPRTKAMFAAKPQAWSLDSLHRLE